LEGPSEVGNAALKLGGKEGISKETSNQKKGSKNEPKQLTIKVIIKIHEKP